MQSCPWVGSTHVSGRVGSWKLASAVGRVGSGRGSRKCADVHLGVKHCVEPGGCHTSILHILSGCVPLIDVLCKRFYKFVLTCVNLTNEVR